jgi:hypothetical protein
MGIVTRAGKGQALTHAELDNNFVELRDRPDGQVYPAASGIGLKLDTDTPDYGWHDLTGEIHQDLSNSLSTPAVYVGGIKQYQFDVGNEAVMEFHMPHDYAPGTNMFIHAHWSHNNNAVTTGSVTWQFEIIYAKGHNQAAFSTPLLVQAVQTASTIRYQHMIAETQASSAGGAGGMIDTGQLEVDGIMIVTVRLLANTMDAGAKPFLHAVDLHYQSTSLPTKNKAPVFYG